MLKILTAILKLIAPVGLKDDPEGQQAWRWAVFICILILMGSVWVQLLYADGKVMGSSGYVQRAQMESELANRAQVVDLATVTQTLAKVSDSVDFLTRESIEQAIRAKLTTACMTQDRAFKAELSAEVQQLEERYYSLTNKGFRQPGCDEL